MDPANGAGRQGGNAGNRRSVPHRECNFIALDVHATKVTPDSQPSSKYCLQNVRSGPGRAGPGTEVRARLIASQTRSPDARRGPSCGNMAVQDEFVRRGSPPSLVPQLDAEWRPPGRNSVRSVVTRRDSGGDLETRLDPAHPPRSRHIARDR